MLARMSSAELTEWMAFANIEPFGAESEYLGSAIVAATVANVNRNPKRGKAFEVKDFLPRFGASKQTVEEQLQIAAMLTAAYNPEAE